MTEPVLKVEDLSLDYEVGGGWVHALSHVSFEIGRGRVVGIVGETGCGKSTLAQAIPRLIPEPPARIRSGKVSFLGTDLYSIPAWKLPMVRGTGIGMVFQEPLNALNPAFRVYDQLAESIRIRQLRESGRAPMFRPGPNAFDYSRRPMPEPEDVYLKAIRIDGTAGRFLRRRRAISERLRAEVLDALRLVRINDPETIVGLYPHELSGGMRQRVMIAMALSEKPSLLIADEPTSALDVTIQAQVLTLMKELIAEVHASILFISHDLGIIAEMADDLGVMYAGHLVEYGPVEEVFRGPRHPYTRALLRAAPTRFKSEGALDSIAGHVPNLSRLPAGCPFHPRCPLARSECRVDPGPNLLTAAVHPALRPGDPDHRSACFRAEEVAANP
jgi:oligopeptide/dipeptide ABC transporter ATP-binding protein